MRDDLDIVLITYNRAEIGFRRTIDSLLSKDSPVCGCAITILDNASTDSTQAIAEEAIRVHGNVRYIRNRFNCGIAGNIIKAMELASRKWLWIICDDDEFNWKAWPEINNALNCDYDIVHTTFSLGYRNESYPYLINEECFIPTCIYNTRLIDGTVISNAYILAYTLFPHHAIGCKVLNCNGKIFVPHDRCVVQHYDNDKMNYIRASREGVFHRLNDYQLLSGYVNAYGLIEDPKLRKQCVDTLCLGASFAHSIRWFLKANPRHNLFNIYDFLASCQGEQVPTYLFTVAYLGERRIFALAILTVVVWPFGVLARLVRCVRNRIRYLLIR